MKKVTYEKPIIQKINTGVPNKFGQGSNIQAVSTIGGISVAELAKQYGSPLYVLSESTIRETYQKAANAFKTRYPKVQFAWSYKTNYLNAVCNIYHQEGSWAEVVSKFEYQKAIANGVPGNKIIFNGPDKSREDLTIAIENESLIHIDHQDEFYEIQSITRAIGKKAKVAIRVNLDTGIQPTWVRFGFNLENGEAWSILNKIMVDDGFELLGLHTHIGTYIIDVNAFATAATKLSQLAVRIHHKYNHPIKYIDLGGGFASKNTLKGAYLPGSDTCPTFDEYAEAITNALHHSDIQYKHMPMLILETGRALIDESGFLIGSVLANKRLPDGRKSLIIDIGINLLFTSFWYEHPIAPAQISSHDTEDTIIYGPLCMNIDIIREAIKFPVVEKGEHVVISRIGAYNMSQWMQFITYRPKIVMIDGQGQTHIVRENENHDTMNALDKIPTHLKKINL